MNFYPHHIGDFDKATRHCSRLERSVYRDLMDLYYDTEKPLSLDFAAVCRKIIANSNEESTAVERVLNEFFTETPTGWYHERCEEEISKYHANNSQKSLAGKASAAKKALKKQQALNGCSTDVERTRNGTPTNQEPRTKNQEPSKGVGLRFDEFWESWPKGDRKQDRKKCSEKWTDGKLDDCGDAILADIAIKRQTEKWINGFIEAPLVYLNNRRWEDGIAVAETQYVRSV